MKDFVYSVALLLAMAVSIAIGMVTMNCWAGAQEQLPPPQEVESRPLIEGFYAVEGKDTEGNAYLGVCLIKRHGLNYLCTWTLESGVVCKGIGSRDKEVLTIAGTSGGSGLCVFRLEIKVVDGKPHLSGYYATGEVRGYETLTWLRGRTL